MSKKSKREKKEGKLPREKGQASPSTSSASASEMIRKRRNKRLLILGVIVVLIPVFELVAYQFRAITVTIANRSEERITKVKVTYPGGSFDTPEIKPDGSFTYVTRPSYTFQRDNFSAYSMTVAFSTEKGGFRNFYRINSLDYSARELFTVMPATPQGPVEIKHTTTPGFPLGTIRDLLTSLGIG